MADEETVVETDEETTNTAIAEFNDAASPKVKTEKFKLYMNMGTAATPDWELQGRGVGSWTIEQNEEITKDNDVLGMVDMERGPSQPVQPGVKINIRKGSKLAGLLFNAWFKNDKSALDAVQILQKFEFVDAATIGSVLARLEDDVMISINTFTGEAGGYLGFECDFHYANKTTTGSMTLIDATPVAFTPDTPAQEQSAASSSQTPA